MDESAIQRAIAALKEIGSKGSLSEKELADVHELLAAAKGEELTPIDAASLARSIGQHGLTSTWSSLEPASTVHSTGAPGSLSTLLAPVLIAAAGFYVPVLSVVGSVAGAIDSLMTVPGYRSKLSAGELDSILLKARLANVGHSDTLFAPADHLLWRLREETSTKSSASLVVASILGKMLALGTKFGSVDVRVGPAGNAGYNFRSAFNTAHWFVATASLLSMRVNCVLSDCTRLSWPRVGRLDAVLSIFDILLSPDKYVNHPHIQTCICVAAAGCHASSPLTSFDDWRKETTRALTSGRAYQTFVGSLNAHGADASSHEILTDLAHRRLAYARIVPPTSQVDPIYLSQWFDRVGSMVGDQRNLLGLAVEADKISCLFPESLISPPDAIESELQRLPLKHDLPMAEATRVLFYTGNLA